MTTLSDGSAVDDVGSQPPEPPHSVRAVLGEGLRRVIDPAVAATVTVITCAMYLPVLLATYGISDDYVDLVKSTTDNSSLPDVAISGGRPVSGLAQEIALSLATDVSSLRWLRLIGVLGVAATAVVASAIARHLRARPAAQIGVGLLVAAMPSSQVVASWAVLFPISWGAAIALAAGYSLRGLSVDRIGDRRWVWATAAIALITLIGLANYQPSAMAFVPGFVLALDDRVSTIARRLRRAASGVVGAGLGGLIYLVLSRALIRARGLQADFRSSLQAPDADKLDWFVRSALARSLDPLSFQPRTWVAVSVAIVILAGFAVRRGTVADRTIGVLLAAAALFASYLPTLMVDDRWPSARSRLATDLTVALFASMSIIWIGNAIVRRARRTDDGASWWTDLALISLATISVLIASWRVTTYYVIPQALEYRLVSNAVDDLELSPASALVIVAATWQEPLAPAVDLDEFGFPSMANGWGPPGLVEIELIDAGRPRPASIVVVSHVDPLPEGSIVVLDIHDMYARVR